MTLNNTLKWIATCLLIIGAGINSFGFYPEGPIILFVGGVVWLIVAIRWREPALILTNLLMCSVSLPGLIKHFYF